MTSGNRVYLVSLALFGLLAAADAGRVGEDGTGAMWIAPELLEAASPAASVACTTPAVVHVTDLSSAGRVAFEWNPATSELSFHAQGIPRQVTLPEDWLSGAQELSLATMSCGSR
ncbi:MAG TPA: hypothetical protein VIV63_07705 [Steroidobacteraceae bacterium]